MTQELAILREQQPNALAFLVDRCEINNRAAVARNRRPDEQIAEVGRFNAGLLPVSANALFIRTHPKYLFELQDSSSLRENYRRSWPVSPPFGTIDDSLHPSGRLPLPGLDAGPGIQKPHRIRGS
jgi:hypothetical protein